MNSKKCVSPIAMLIAVVVAVGNSGCGGSSIPPPPIGVSVSAATATVLAGATGQFTATVANDAANKGVTWSVSCSTARFHSAFSSRQPSSVRERFQ